MTELALSGTAFSAQGGAMTEVGTPRAQTLIIDALDGRVNNPTQMNPYLQSTLFNEGLNQLAYSALWEMNTVTGKQFPALAAKMPDAKGKKGVAGKRGVASIQKTKETSILSND